MQAPQAAAEVHKDAGADSLAVEDETGVPTPLRVRRSSSPAPVTPQSRSLTSERSQRIATQGSQPAITEAGRQLPGQQRIGLLAGLAMLAFALLVGFWPKLLHEGHSRSSMSEEGSPSTGSHEASVTPRTEPEPEEGPTLPSLVSKALGCPGARADVLDVLAGAPYEFSGDGLQGQAFFRLPRLAAAAAKVAVEASSDSAASEDEFSKAVLQMAATGGGWPPAFQARLLAALEAPCEAKPICASAQNPLDMEVDDEFTSERARSSGAIHQAILSLGAMTQIPILRARAEAYRSLPPSVVLSPAPISQRRDCFAVRGANASLALRLSQGSSVIQQLVVEQPSRVAAIRPGSMPQRFAIYGAPAEKEVVAHENPYTELLGKFEYAAAAPAVQAFELLPSSSMRGLRLVFEGFEVEDNYICLYRVKAFEGKGPACSGERVATATSK